MPLVELSAPIVAVIRPPLHVGEVNVHEPPLPATVKLPDVFERKIPLGAPPPAATLAKDTTSGVSPPARLTSTAVAPLVDTAPPVEVMVIVLSVASNPRCPPSGEIFREPKVIAPVLDVRLTPVLPDPVELVLPKFNAALELSTLSPTPVEFVIVVVAEVRKPWAFAKPMPVVALSVEEILSKVAARVPPLRLNACPVPFRVTSETVKVPNRAPVISEVAFPTVNPRSKLSEAKVMAIVPLVRFTMIPLPLSIAGNGSLAGGGVRPVMLERLAVASCPINR